MPARAVHAQHAAASSTWRRLLVEELHGLGIENAVHGREVLCVRLCARLTGL